MPPTITLGETMTTFIRNYYKPMLLVPWSMLGGYRGYQEYDQNYKKEYNHYIRQKNNGYKNPREPHFYYLSSVGMSIMFAGAYIPCVGFFLIKELYNFEEWVRGIKDKEEDE